MYKKKQKYSDGNKPFKWKQAEGKIILWAVRWYCRYAISYNDLKEMAAERGLLTERSTLFRWVQEYAPELNSRIRPYLRKVSNSWKLDETYLKIKGKWQYLYRAIDKNGQTLDWMLSSHRNKKAAKKFFKKLLGNKQATQPRVINVDKNPSFPPAHNELQAEGVMPITTTLRRVKYLNNAMENDHKSIKCKCRYRQWFQSFATARNTIDGLESMRVLQKGQIRYVAKADMRAQNVFINRLFGISA